MSNTELLTCPRCRNNLTYTLHQAGTVVSCPHCGQSINLPPATPLPPHLPNAPPTITVKSRPPLERKPAQDLAPLLLKVSAVVGTALILLLTWGREPGPLVAINYVAALILFGWLGFKIGDWLGEWLKTPTPIDILVTLTIFAGLLFAYARLDTYEEIDRTKFSDGRSRLTVTTHRRSGRPIKEFIQVERGDGQTDFFLGGPLSESGKWHGKWTYTSFDPFYSESSWYWYGEEVSEGRWHELNR